MILPRQKFPEDLCLNSVTGNGGGKISVTHICSLLQSINDYLHYSYFVAILPNNTRGYSGRPICFRSFEKRLKMAGHLKCCEHKPFKYLKPNSREVNMF